MFVYLSLSPVSFRSVAVSFSAASAFAPAYANVPTPTTPALMNSASTPAFFFRIRAAASAVNPAAAAIPAHMAVGS